MSELTWYKPYYQRVVNHHQTGDEIYPQLGGKSGNIIRQQAADELVQQPVEELFQQAAEKIQSLIRHQAGDEKGHQVGDQMEREQKSQQVVDQIEVAEKGQQVADQLEMLDTYGINPWSIISIFPPKTKGEMRYE